MYPTGEHPFWCDLIDCDRPDDPNHIGRTSHMFVQTSEARVSLQLSRIDDSAPAGTWAGPVQVRLTLNRLARHSHGRALTRLNRDAGAAVQVLCGDDQARGPGRAHQCVS